VNPALTMTAIVLDAWMQFWLECWGLRCQRMTNREIP
jgi:hypothetical protein